MRVTVHTCRDAFLSTLSLRRATGHIHYMGVYEQISIHALLAESDHNGRVNLFRFEDFYPRSPCGERRVAQGADSGHKINFYPRSPCGERQTVMNNIVLMPGFLSTLSLRRATKSGEDANDGSNDFYPRSPCGERQLYDTYAKVLRVFLSTLSLRRATWWVEGDRFFYYAFLSTLSLRRATSSGFNFRCVGENFYPRSPCGERRRGAANCYLDKLISIHALLAESDCLSIFRLAPAFYFYPRSPCGERRFNPFKTFIILAFLSTLSLRRATANNQKARQGQHISIHALLAESDTRILTHDGRKVIFLSTLSLRRATTL